jgi:hypothetical protein
MRGGKEKRRLLFLLVALLRLKSSFSSPFHFRGNVPYVSNLDFLTPNATLSSSSSVLADGTLTLTGDHVTPFFNANEPLSRAKRFSFSCSVFLFDDRDNYENGGALISRMSSPEHPAFALTIEPPSSSSISGKEGEDVDGSLGSRNYDDDGVNVAEKGSAVSFAMTFRKTHAVRKATSSSSPGEVVASFTVSGKSRRRLVANRWHHVALVVGEDTVAFYLDGFVDVEYRLPPNAGSTQRGGLFLSPHATNSNSLDDALSIGGESRGRRRRRMSTLKARFEPPSGLKGLVHGPRLRMVFDEDEGEDEEASAEECDCYHEEEEKEEEEGEGEEEEEEEEEDGDGGG